MVRKKKSYFSFIAIFILLLMICLFLVFLFKNESNNNVKQLFSKDEQQNASNYIDFNNNNNNELTNQESNPAFDHNDKQDSSQNFVEPNETKSNEEKIALIIDDLGYAQPNLVSRLCKLPIMFDVAILPHQEFTKKSAEIAHRYGKEIMVHLPMEPNGYPGPGKDPGPGAVMYNLSEHEVRNRVRKAMLNVPFYKGVNNHMGSRITQNRDRMTWVLEEIKYKKCFFVDSFTEKNSVAFNVAYNLHIPSVKRQVFLDINKDINYITKQWLLAMKIARDKGEVVIIGHICPETVAALEKLTLNVNRSKFVAVSSLVY